MRLFVRPVAFPMLVALTAALGACGSEDDERTVVPDDVGVDVPTAKDAGVDRPAVDAGTPDSGRLDAGAMDVGVDVPRVDATMDAARETGVDAPTVDLPAVDLPAVDSPAVDAPGVDVPAVDASGGYVIGAANSDAISARGGSSEAVTGTTTSACAAGEVAVGLAVQLEGRGYVGDARIQCAALDATGRAFGAASWPAGDPPADWNVASCAAGQALVGVRALPGDILDGLGGLCAPLGWSAASARASLGPWGAAGGTDSLCTPGAAIGRFDLIQVSYFGGTTGIGFSAGCRAITAR